MQKNLSCYGLNPSEAMQIINSHVDEFYKLIYKYCGGCQEIMNSVYLYIATKNIFRYDPSLNLSTFIINSAKLYVYNHRNLRRNKNLPCVENIDFPDRKTERDRLEEKEMLELIKRVCSERDYSILHKYHIDGLTMAQISKEVGLSTEGVRFVLTSSKRKILSSAT